jgi:hypothetical protein
LISLRRHAGLATLLTFGIVLAGATTASADYKFSTKWGGAGTNNGQFEGAFGVGVNSGGSRVYAVDTGNYRVQEFDSSGTFIRKWGGQGSGQGKFGHDGPSDVAVSPAGNVWVTDPSNNRVEKFTSAGSYLFHIEGGDGDFDGPYGVATNPDGDAYVADVGKERIERFTGTGMYLTHWDVGNQGPFPNDSPYAVAADSSGNVWVSLCGTAPDNHAFGTVAEYGPSGSFVRQWDLAPSTDTCADGIVITPTDRVLAAANDKIQEYTRTGTLIRQFGPDANDVAVDGSGVVYAATNLHVFKFVPSPPQTTITSGPSSFTNDNDVSFDYSSSEANSDFECKVDSESWFHCGPGPEPISGLADGQHTFRVHAIDPDGFTDTTAAKRTFTVDTVAPNTTITSGPANNELINDPTPTFKFTSSESGSTFGCKRDSGNWVSCTSPHTTANFADGTHTWYVRAKDKAGNRDPSPASRTFTVDTTAVVSIASHPVTLTPSGVAKVDVTCPSSEASGGCGGTLTLKTHDPVLFNGETKRVQLGSADFLIATGGTTTINVQLSSSKQQLVADNDPLATDAIADVGDLIDNTGTSTQTFTLSAP